ncbi:30S ribosome-binding factor RbfA [Pigmentiphaga sp.]|uniref:30S ribosome-binding factor RbfA n=1 Tax=Pigmentiphaga sp. TaxID=1977564 RepID=UPI00128E5575|nr:30S ribosome-binding factor RbfA [Pigmentiphaga sp.]MPS28881.1 30S ribosome-binding factor RbfA [Alcaligenaceae bacterium SAGV5]MPS52635.1 30S ribosome-binding factor RbfA [Alcaligenaceae bacterium SAGV3]MPT60462.1 30S ribosome-binding factor RbfA [Alcaligenaceae bacterium]
MSRHRQKKLPGGRTLRLADQIQKDLAEMIQREVDVARAGLVTLTGVDLTPDYAHAKVYFTVMGAEPSAAETALNEKAGWLHSLLFKRLHIHTVPTLHFFHDRQMSRGMEMNRLIAQANTPGVLADELAESGQAGQDARESIAPAEPSAPDDDRA